MVQTINRFSKVEDPGSLAGTALANTIVRGSSEPNFKSIAASDMSVARIGVFYALIASSVWLIQSYTDNGKPLLSAILSGMFAVHIFGIRKSIADPAVVFSLIMFFYSFIPLVADTGYTHETLGFDLSVAYSLYNAGQIATMLAIALSIYLIPQRPEPEIVDERVAMRNMETSLACVAGGLLSGVFAIALISAYIAKKGFVLGGQVSYGESFTEHLDAGSGTYMLCVPLAISSLALLMVSRHPATRLFLLVPLFCFLEILVGIGQRKYMLEPALFLVAFYWRARHAYQIAFVIIGAVGVFIIFCFLGYLRLNGLEISNLLNDSAWNDFFNYIGVYIGSETVALYATSAAAVGHVIEPLPNFGDYTRSWIFAVPHFFLEANKGAAGSLYLSANDRFSNAYDAKASMEGMGWGFSFLGEAYMVGGLPMIFVIVTLQVVGFRYLYVRGGGERQIGLFGALSIVSIYFAIWTQRNAFAYTLKEFIIDGISIIFALYVAGRSLSLMLLPILAKVRLEKTFPHKALP